MSDVEAIARAFVAARLEGRSLAAFPGAVPRDLATAYAVQDAALKLWPERPIGWKVGRIADELVATLGANRLIGPIFPRETRRTGAESARFPVINGGFAAVEAEFVISLAENAPAAKHNWTAAEAAGLAGELCIGVETAGSPLATINALGPTVVVSDFGNNNGLILGSAVPDWRDIPEARMTAETFIDGVSVGSGSAADLPGGLFAALAFALETAARRGMPLRRGDLVSTGAVTGVHEVTAGQQAVCVFAGLGRIACAAT